MITKFKIFENTDIPLIKFGDYILTKNDLDTKYKDKITMHFGYYNIDSALYTLYDTETIYNNGGWLYRVIWLDDKKDFNKDDLGHHWVTDEYDIENITQIFSMYDRTLRDKKCFIIKSYTPPKNVTIASDYWNNLEEHEIEVIDPKKLINITLTEYKN